MKAFVATALMCLTAATANAAVECGEKVTRLIAHENGEIYFTSEKTCPTSWCQLNFSAGPEADKKAYAMMMSAMASQTPVVFYWPNINSCTTTNALYASPGYVYILG